MLEVIRDVVERERDVSPVVAADPDATSVGAGDGAKVTVEDTEVVAVLKGEDAVADAVALVVDGGGVRAELPGAFEGSMRALVQVSHVAAVDGAHDDVTAGVAMTPPIEDHLVAEGVAVVGDRDVAMLVEALDGELGSALA